MSEGNRASVLGHQGRFQDRDLEGWPGPAAWRQDACSLSQHAPPPVGHGACPPQAPPRQRAWPASVCHRPGVQLRPPAHSGTMERQVGVSWGGLGTGAGDKTPGEGREGKRGSWCFLEGLVSPKALGQRSASGMCGRGRDLGARGTKDGTRTSPAFGG